MPDPLNAPVVVKYAGLIAPPIKYSVATVGVGDGAGLVGAGELDGVVGCGELFKVSDASSMLDGRKNVLMFLGPKTYA